MRNLKIKVSCGVCLTAAFLAFAGPIASAIPKNNNELTANDFRGLQVSSTRGNPKEATLLAPTGSMTVAPVIMPIQYYDDEEDQDEPSATEVMLEKLNRELEENRLAIEESNRRTAERQAQYDAEVQRQADEYRAQQRSNQQGTSQKSGSGNMEGCSWSEGNNIWVCN